MTCRHCTTIESGSKGQRYCKKCQSLCHECWTGPVENSSNMCTPCYKRKHPGTPRNKGLKVEEPKQPSIHSPNTLSGWTEIIEGKQVSVNPLVDLVKRLYAGRHIKHNTKCVPGPGGCVCGLREIVVDILVHIPDLPNVEKNGTVLQLAAETSLRS